MRIVFAACYWNNSLQRYGKNRRQASDTQSKTLF